MNEPKILLVGDVRGWIFDRHCREIETRLGKKFNFTVVFEREIPGVNLKKYDLICLLDGMWADSRYYIPVKRKVLVGVRNEFFEKL